MKTLYRLLVPGIMTATALIYIPGNGFCAISKGERYFGRSTCGIVQHEIEAESGRAYDAERINEQGDARPFTSSGPVDPDKDSGAVMLSDMEWIKAQTREYSPVTWEMLMRYDRLPFTNSALSADGQMISSTKTTGTFYYLLGNDRKSLLTSMRTNVHETAHQYFLHEALHYAREHDIHPDRHSACGYIYISCDTGYFIDFPVSRMFPSKELTGVIPGIARTLRFNTYIEGNYSSILGLLNEFHAYYLGAKYNYDMFNAWKLVTSSPSSGLFEWVSHTQSSIGAYFEFDFFIREYLLYMKDIYPDDYRALVHNPSFVDAYLAIRKAYQQLTVDYQDRVRSEIRNMRAEGSGEAWIAGRELWIPGPDSNTVVCTRILPEDYDRLSSILHGKRYRRVEIDLH